LTHEGHSDLDAQVNPGDESERRGEHAVNGAEHAEKRIHASEQQSCSPGVPHVMITGHVPAVRAPPDHATNRVAAAVRRKETWKTAGILIPRHQLAVLQRRQPRRPKLNWAD